MITAMLESWPYGLVVLALFAAFVWFIYHLEKSDRQARLEMEWKEHLRKVHPRPAPRVPRRERNVP